MSRAQVRTWRQNMTGLRYLGEYGPVDGLAYDFTVPGGCNQLVCNLGIPPVKRTDAMDPGRIVEVVLGASVVWEGILDEPQPTETGWTLTAHGSGTYGSEFAANYGGDWATAVPDTVINNAISRGLDWLASSEGHPPGIYLGQPQDPASIQIDAMLNQITSHGGLTWQIKRTPQGNEVQLFALPGNTPNSLLVCADPAPRTLAGDYNAIAIRYQSTPDLNHNPAKHNVTFATDDASIARHGRMETFIDISDAGAMLASDAQAIGNLVLQRYQRAQFAGPFTVAPGQLLTLGGGRRDLGIFYHGDPMVCRLILTDQGWGGEVSQQSVSFLVGQYAYDDDTGSATVTPFNSIRHDISTLLSLAGGHAHRRRIIRRRHGRDVEWRFAGSRKWHTAHNVYPPPPRHKHRHHTVRG